MSESLTEDEIVNYVRQFFKPHKCIAEVWDYGAKLRLKITDEHERVIASVPSVSLSSIRHITDLNTFCEGIVVRVSSLPPVTSNIAVERSVPRPSP